MARDRRPAGLRDCVGRRDAIGRKTWGVAAALCAVLVSAYGAMARERAPLDPYGTYAEIQQCVTKMEASLHGRSILGSRETAAYIQDRGFLEDMGVTEYDVMVGRCKTMFFHRYNRLNGRPQ